MKKMENERGGEKKEKHTQTFNGNGVQNLRLKEKEQKLTRELDRLRSHLLQMEEGYTREALEAEEREKDLRTRLARAEEQLLSSTSQVQSARLVAVVLFCREGGERWGHVC